ncbi:transcriptional regulator [Nocardia farcinica]|uniref:transcriptional regulator n=1 Tax=Nocardia farcinica TaxID=37329 RepID=UPI001894C547|nr:transcriptional regulator [Nocardia farcinica]MBF6070282.1 transcriptional regulator [Nocardia farcinica]MBF6262650.1 transcriptional regulator [Nocardia farcinica]MBF6281154.1 transcriptional regulator [Nocardia farcinica]MBF6306050.1 transcriptional regulator [Nocardia farcinica]MBF6389722.1 transcriptional regulator [Nocardia farcinica]
MANTGNAALKAARVALGYRSQSALADAVTETARNIGLRVEVSARTVRRWESASPSFPQAEHVTALEALFDRPITELGFTPPWTEGKPAHGIDARPTPTRQRIMLRASDLPRLTTAAAADYASITAAHRRFYWTLSASSLHHSAREHAHLGMELLDRAEGRALTILAPAVAESNLLSGRLEFFDLDKPGEAHQSFGAALQAAQHTGDSLLGAAVLAHMAFAPAFSGDPQRAEEARERIAAARAFARRGRANGELLAWIDAVAAEVDTRFGDTKAALAHIAQAEQAYAAFDPAAAPSPLWLDWFSPTRLGGFKANTLISLGRGREAAEILRQVLDDLPADAVKQRSVYLADAAAAAVLMDDPDQACAYLQQALTAISQHWYWTALDRVKAVRTLLRRWDSLPAVRELDERLYDWHTTVHSLTG